VVEIRDRRREVAFAAAEDDLAIAFETRQNAPQHPPCIGASEVPLILHLGHKHAQVHPAPAAAADGFKNGLGIEFSWLVVCHRGVD